jgi:hypothetical protein
MVECFIRLKIEQNWDTVNRILNRFCGKDFLLKEIHIGPSITGSSECTVLVMGELNELKLTLKKILAYDDVTGILEFKQLQNLN